MDMLSDFNAGAFLLMLAQILVPVMLLASGLPRRSHFSVRVAACAVGLVACTLAIGALSKAVFSEERPLAASVSLLATFALVLVAFLLVVLTLFETSVWTAFFCCGAGYTAQNLASALPDLLESLSGGAFQQLPLDRGGHLVSMLSCAVVYLICYPLFFRKVQEHGLVYLHDKSTLLFFIFVVLAVVGYDVVVKELAGVPIPDHNLAELRIFHVVICVFALFASYKILCARQFADEVTATELLMQRSLKQYEASKETIDAINLKCHDIRHQIRTLRDGGTHVDQGALDDLSREIRIYDSSMQTGNEALDVILTEKSLLCERHGISLTCIADGAAFSFLSTAETYSLFGNALDNAIEAVLSLPEAEDRAILLDARRRKEMAVMHTENRLAGTLEFRDGLPQTIKPDINNHGFGMRSIRTIAQRHGGTVTATAQDGTFHLNVMMAMPGGHG